MRRNEYPIHPDFRAWKHMNPPLNKVMLPAIQGLLRPLFDRERSSGDMAVERKTIPVGGGASIRALLYAPKGLEGSAPCLVDYHGGGFVLPAAPYHYTLAREYARRARCKVLFPEYRLAPRHPFPTAPEDCFAAYAWAVANAAELGTVTGAEGSEARRKYTDTPMCNSRDMEKYGRYYLRDRAAGKHVWSAPVDAESLAGLPPAYIETAEFDCLRDDGILYARRLDQSGVSVELNNTEGTMHGFDIVLDSPIVRACADRRIGFLKRIFGEGM